MPVYTRHKENSGDMANNIPKCYGSKYQTVIPMQPFRSSGDASSKLASTSTQRPIDSYLTQEKVRAASSYNNAPVYEVSDDRSVTQKRRYDVTRLNVLGNTAVPVPVSVPVPSSKGGMRTRKAGGEYIFQ